MRSPTTTTTAAADDIVTPDTEAGGDDDSTSSTSPAAAGTTTMPTPTTAARATTGATVVVANASGIGGSAGAMTTALEGAGYTMGTAGNSTAEQLATSLVYYVAGDPAAQAVAQSVATDMGGLQIAEMPSPPPIDAGLGTSTVLVMVGADTANKTLADLNPSAVAPPAVVGETDNDRPADHGRRLRAGRARRRRRVRCTSAVR